MKDQTDIIKCTDHPSRWSGNFCAEIPDEAFTAVSEALDALAEQVRVLPTDERDKAYKLIASFGEFFGMDGGFGPTVTGYVSADGEQKDGPTGEQWGAP